MIIMKTLYIVGNGFDMAHGLQTRYWKLREYIEQRDPVFLNLFEVLYDIHPLDDTEPWYTDEAQDRWNKAVDKDLWSDFEKMMGNPNTASMLDQSISATEGMPSEGIRYHMDLYWQEQFGFISKLQNYLKDWIESVDTSAVKCKKVSLLNSEDYFLNFNYTDTLEKVYRVENVLHIHGGVSSICDISPIIGHCNAEDIKKHKKWAKEADAEFAEAEASIHEAISNYLDEIYKDTKEQISFNQQFFDALDIVNHVVIIGWSAGNVDIPYLKEIVKCVNKDTKWTVYWYDADAYDSLTNAFKNLGIIDNKVIEYIHSEEFWDK